MPRAKKSTKSEAVDGASAKPVGGFKRGRVGPDERAQILEATAAGTSVADASAKFMRSLKVIQAVVDGTAGLSKAGQKPKKAAATKGKPGRPRKDATLAKQSAPSAINLRQIISDIVAQEVKQQLQQAFQ